MGERKATSKRRAGNDRNAAGRRGRARAATPIAKPVDLAALLDRVGTMSDESAEVLEEALRWARGEGH
jgi:hypothetical protein